MAENPYVGPRAFTEDESDKFHGRSTESQELISLILARRAVLLYSQSGAGKTSLLRASVLPELRRRKRFEVLPIARVTGADQADGNLYLANTIAALFPGRPELANATLAEAFAANQSTVPRLLILDQFEEIFTFHPELTEQRREFFEQLGDCLDQFPRLCLLLSMREDYLAFLDGYAELLPDRLRARLRLTRLGVQNALKAISLPAANGRPFAPGVAENLVDNLRRLPSRAVLGLEVEPVQLQIVCRQLWEAMPATATSIEAADVEKYAKVDDVLTRFYRNALMGATSPLVRERRLRQWCGEKLITASRTRGLVYRGESETDGLPNECAEVLRNAYLIRPINRGDDIWFELCHDRLIEPILEDNRAWFEQYPNPLARAIKEKVELLSGSALDAAVAYNSQNPGELNAEESKLLEKSQSAARAVKSRRRRIIAITAAVIVLLAVLVVWTREREREATENLQKVKKSVAESYIMEASLRALDRPDEALAYLEQALRYDPSSTDARTWIACLLMDAQRWLPVSTGGPVENDPTIVQQQMPYGLKRLSRGDKELANIQAPEMTIVAQIGPRIFTQRPQEKESIVWEPAGDPSSTPVIHPPGQTDALAFLPNGELMTLADRVEVWDIATGNRKAHLLSTTESNYFDISADGRFAITGKGSAHVQIIEIATGAAVTIPHAQRQRVAALSPNGTWAATFGADGVVQFWESKTGKALAAVPVHVSARDGGIPRVAISEQKPVAAIAGSTTLKVINLETGAMAGGETRQPQDLPLAVALSKSGDQVAIVNRPGLILVYDVRSGQRSAPAMMDGSFLTKVTFSADGRKLLSGANDAARLWDIRTGRPSSLPLIEERLTATAITPDGRRIATASKNGTAHVYDIAIGDGTLEEAPILADLASAAGGHTVVATHSTERQPFARRRLQIEALRKWAETNSNRHRTLAAFIRIYLNGIPPPAPMPNSP